MKFMYAITYFCFFLITANISSCNQKAPIDRTQLVETYLHHPYMEGMSTGIEAKNLMADLFRGIQRKEYQEVLDQINKMEYEKNMRLFNMRAICLLGVKDYDTAEEMFLEMKNNMRETKVLRNDASWHLLLLYLESGRDEQYNAEMRYHLNYPTHLYYEEAKELFEITGEL